PALAGEPVPAGDRRGARHLDGRQLRSRPHPLPGAGAGRLAHPRQRGAPRGRGHEGRRGAGEDPRHGRDRGPRPAGLRGRHHQPLLPGGARCAMKFWQVASFSEPDQLLEIARGAEDAGFHGLLLSDHLFFPGTLRSKYPYAPDGKPAFGGTTPFPDPWTAIAAMAAVTERLCFGTLVYILPLRHPLEVAKTVGTAALLSG